MKPKQLHKCIPLGVLASKYEKLIMDLTRSP